MWLNPLSSQALHHKCISLIVSRFTTLTEDVMICSYQVTKNFCSRYGFTCAFPTRGPCHFGPLANLVMSVFREVGRNTVFARYHSSLRIWRGFMRRARVWVSMLRDCFIHKILSEFLQPFRYFGKWQVAPYLLVIHIFILVLGFWLGWTKGCSVLARLHCHMQLMLELVLSLYFPAVMMLEMLNLTSLTKRTSSTNPGPRLVRSFPCCIVSEHRFWWDKVFGPLDQSYEYPWSSRSFPSESTAGVSSRIFTVRDISNSLT